MMLDLLILTDSYPPLLGGGEIVVQKICEAFGAHGARVSVLTPKRHGIEFDASVTEIECLQVAGVRIMDPASLYRQLKKRKPTAVLLMGPSANNLSAGFLSLRRRIPTFTFYFGDLNWASWPGRMLQRPFFRWLLPKCAIVFTYSRNLVVSLVERGVPADKIVFSGIASDLPLFSEPVIDRDNAIVFIGGLGRSHQYKRPDLLLRALPLLSDVRTTIRFIGGGDSAWLKALANSLDVADRVSFLGVLDEAEKRRLLRRARALVLPSPTAREGFGLVVLEAMRCGTPVVVGVRAGAAELVDRTGFGATWAGYAPADLARAIDTVLNFSPVEVHGGFRNFSEISPEFSWEKVSPLIVGRMNAALGRASAS
ncbi:MAG: glycosyltransferase family 4 protein [Candidatus Eremiobacteraeota bacterium]|nr:glycosyltransferase family 4 protein [Candidatus Eremiobacteraeota bacterium]MBC5828332.1 glycosyltransferase family 4 protein [Candidatus Eremiobacteraeota bacterium]